MSSNRAWSLAWLLLPGLIPAMAGCCWCHTPAKRVGIAMGLRAERAGEYKALPAGSNAGVRDLLAEYHMHNFTIFLREIDGKLYEFGYYEHTGKDFGGDAACLAQEPRDIEWLQLCDPVRVPLPGARSWTRREEVHFNHRV